MIVPLRRPVQPGRLGTRPADAIHPSLPTALFPEHTLAGSPAGNLRDDQGAGPAR